MLNSTQILDAAMAVPGVAWFWGLGLTVKLSFLGVVLAAYPVVTHILGKFKKKNNDSPSQNVEVNVNVPEREDSQKLAEKVYEDQRKDLKEAQRTILSKDEEITALKDVIDGLREPQETQKETDYAAQAEAELAKGNTDLAKAFFNEEAKKNVEAGNESYVKAAQAYRRLGALNYMNNPKEALKYYQKSVELDPNSAEGWNRLGHLLLRLGDHAGAKLAYNNVRDIGIGREDLKWVLISSGNIANVCCVLGDINEAEKNYNKILKYTGDQIRDDFVALPYISPSAK
ncbi:tetratricopeptide repeat protein [Desulfovibrio sp. JC022]|uniref:tetratricopeptide repeat protein n=1 Tax=Desulfovibrio sp. JC022 TaxID=2593642 RepID=UPI0013D6F4C6|nr:tetratricopeptide repeat protein [Desulfovibrio sp. JC022]NDV24783.1 tetratricopeptide repeat protein [Desulfovibrio sp. JC022]